ncbi:AmmeMemoRadiSam system protein B [Balneola sp. MJW-20]|uniref:AmmeMemoRadiSam system protein B n=1 Tax=Gracilimonas aurantiaca TaxID=3234185 RepID=UPI0034665A9F
MNISTYSKKEIRSMIDEKRTEAVSGSTVRMLFVPNHVNEENFDEFLSTYSQICGQEYDSVIVIESHTQQLDKKLSMPSNLIFKTKLGEITVNDKLRNEFCDEEDDFFIADEGYSKKMSLYDQLPFLQSCLDEFEILSLQIGGYDPAIVRELAFTIDELMLNRNSLIVFCCDIPAGKPAELETLRDLVINKNDTGLLHYLNSNDKNVKGARTFMTGILVARAWDLNVEFKDDVAEKSNITGFARLQQQVAV